MTQAMTREIGSTGVEVYPIGWGPMPLSLSGRPSERDAMAVFRAALDAGVDFWDTADSYCIDDKEPGHGERLIATALKTLGVAGRIRVATKGGMTRPRGSWVRNGRPAHLRKVCEQSLRNLGVEQIFLYQFHWPDPAVPYAESIGALADLQREGKVRHLGISNASPAQLAEALRIVRVESVQNRCSPLDQEDFHNGLVQRCAEARIAYIPYSPMGGGAGKRQMSGNPVLKSLAREHGVSPYRIVLAWLLGKSPNILPIPGASKAASLTDSAAAARLSLKPGDAAKIDALGR